ncbi:MAG: polyribonucleotide nucleotidyltransferase [Candidatus Falkowbacteria bacterium]
MLKRWETEFGGKKLIIESGELAQQANASCTVQYGDTVVLATVVMNPTPRENASFFPLMVDYEEKMYAAGRIKSSRFIKRETKPTDEAILTARMIDRGIRPLFDASIRQDVQVVITVLSVDGENDADIPAIIGASTVLHMSNIPWNGPVAGIRVGRINDEWVINPTYVAREKSDMDICLTLSKDKILMLEAGANEINEDAFYEATKFAFKHVQKVIKLIEQIREEAGQEKLPIFVVEPNEEQDKNQKTSAEEFEKLLQETHDFVFEKINAQLFNEPKATKSARKKILRSIEEITEAMLVEKQIGKDKRKKLLEDFEEWANVAISQAILKDDKRVDGRALTEIRQLDCKVGLLPRTHGSSLFNRGETQALSIVTLGSPGDEQVLDGMEVVGKKKYMHHYNFPPYSVGEASPMRGTGRREIGHGALAEKAIVPVLPNPMEFPYTIRVVSEVLGSNGSSSMASTCASTLALMDAGVPIKKPVAGIAMGLASDAKGNYKIITDLQDLEDGIGGMDFKIAGTRDGITAVQMDTKTDGLSLDIIKDTLKQAKAGRLQILDKIEQTISAPRPELSPFAPRIITLHINPDKIRDVIGPGGKIINEIIDKTGVQIDIEQDGSVFITGTNAEGAARAQDWVISLTKEVAVGEIYTGKVSRLFDFGVMVEILPKTEGLIHISEISNQRVRDVRDVYKIGQEVTAKVIGIDEKGRVNLSVKQLKQ